MNRILIVRMSALGDIVHALPVLGALRDAHPSAEIDWLVDARYAGILDFVDGIDTRIVVRGSPTSRGTKATNGTKDMDGTGGQRALTFPGTLGAVRALRYLRRRHYDVAVDLQGLIKSASLAGLSGARRVIGFERRALREANAAWFYGEFAPVPAGAHIIDKNCSVLPLLGVQPGEVRFPFRAPASTLAETLDTDAHSRGDGRFVLLNPGAAWPNKRWPPDRFGELARRIRERLALPSFVLWGRGELALADAVAGTSAGAATRAPETSLGDLLALAQRATLMVSGDTGPIHLAAAMGTPIVGLYGPTWPERNGPWHPDDETVSRAGSCACHHKRQCQRERMCLSDVTVDEVLAAVERRLAKVQRR